MKNLTIIFIIAGINAAVLTACQNPMEKGKGNYQKDRGDTVKKAPDSTKMKSHLNSDDTARRY